MAFKMEIAIKFCLEAKMKIFQPEKKKGELFGPIEQKKNLIPEIFWKSSNIIILASKK